MCWPSTARSVVCAICDVATMKFSTCTIAAFGSTMRKYATAFTRTGTLSFVMTSCGGMFSVIVRRSTFTSWSTSGIFQTMPGPRGGVSRRPSRNMIPRSYSRMILTKPSMTRSYSYLRTVSSRPWTASTSTCSPGTRSLASSACACHSSPLT